MTTIPIPRSPYSTEPHTVKEGDVFCFVVVAVAGPSDDWSAYRIPVGAGNENTLAMDALQLADYCTRYGDKIDMIAAQRLFITMRATGRIWRR